MPEAKVAKIFKNGASQAVRLPSEFRFDATEVYISRDERTQDVILSMRPGAHVWNEFFAFVREIETPDGWMEERPMNVISRERKPLFREDD